MCKYVDELKECGYKKKCIKTIAQKHNLKESELKRYFQTKFFSVFPFAFAFAKYPI